MVGCISLLKSDLIHRQIKLNAKVRLRCWKKSDLIPSSQEKVELLEVASRKSLMGKHR